MKKFICLISASIFCIMCLSANAGTIDGRFYPIFVPEQNNTATNYKPKPIDNIVGQYNNKIKIVFSDIDGTIIPFNKTGPKGVVPESAKLAAENLRKAQIPLILVTGRSSWEGKEIAKRMDNPNTYIIGQQGAEILDPSAKLIYQDFIKNKDAKRMIKEIKKFNKDKNQNSKIFVFNNGKLYMEEKYELPYLIEEIKVINSFDDLKNLTPVKIGIYESNPEKLKSIQAHLKRKFTKYHIDISADCYCDISSLSATKGNAIKKVADILGIDLKNSATFGDNENDITMLKQVKAKGGLSIAIGNAVPKLKNAAEYITLPANENGFAKGVEKILENNSKLK